jgi:inner membrane protein involved in colicin E2 resistance
MSPSEKAREGDGWRLRWQFERLVTGNGMGMVMPEKVQPGPLAASMSFSAPISLALFMVWIHVLGLLRRIEVHPINHVFLAAAFFAFHLLFGYTVDHLPVEAAFALSATVSVVLVVSYLRLVVGPRFAFVEAGLAQLLYLVGFSLAHFWEGFTGLTVTVLGIVTLFALMQLTGRIKWAEVLARGSLEAPEVG